MVATETNSGELAALARYRSQVYGLLAWLFLERRGSELAARLAQPDVRESILALDLPVEAWAEAAQGWELLKKYLARAQALPAAKVADELGVDRTRLLGGLAEEYGPPPPYETMYRGESRTLMGPVAQEVARFYNEAGFQVAEEIHEPPDHVGVELDFMAALAAREAGAWEEGDQEKALAWQERQRKFLEAHLGQWMPQLCERLVGAAATDFFRGVAYLAWGWVKTDASWLAD